MARGMHPPRDIPTLLSEKLSAGWTMLATACIAPTCAVPLMRSPDRLTTLCVSCGHNYGSTVLQSAPPASTLDRNIANQQTMDLETGLASAAVALAPSSNGTMDAVHLACNGVAENGPQDGLDSHMDDDVSEEDAREAERASRAREAQIRLSDDRSSAISEHLLQGWAMLAAHCPICLSPIMRDRQRRQFCVVCNLQLVREGEAGARAQAASPPPSNSIPALPATSHPAPPNPSPPIPTAPSSSLGTHQTSPDAAAPSHQTPDGSLQGGARERGRQLEGRSELAAGTAEVAVGTALNQGDGGGMGEEVLEPAPKRQATEGGGGMEPSSLVAVVDATLLTLAARLESARRRLESSSEEKEIQIFATIAECAKAIAAVQWISKPAEARIWNRESREPVSLSMPP